MDVTFCDWPWARVARTVPPICAAACVIFSPIQAARERVIWARLPTTSLPMTPEPGISRCGKADEATLPVLVGDMATTRAPGGFCLVYLVWNSVSNLRTQPGQVECFPTLPGTCARRTVRQSRLLKAAQSRRSRSAVWFTTGSR